jgi:hypothetical protein
VVTAKLAKKRQMKAISLPLVLYQEFGKFIL